MGETRSFDGVIEEGDRGGALVAIPFPVHEAFGVRGRVPVTATFDGHPYRGSIVPMGGRHVLGVSSDVRAAIGKGVGDTVSVTVEHDTALRIVDVPPELAASLDRDATAKARYDALSYTHRREYAQWVAEAKRPETRERRAAKAAEMLREGRTR